MTDSKASQAAHADARASQTVLALRGSDRDISLKTAQQLALYLRLDSLKKLHETFGHCRDGDKDQPPAQTDEDSQQDQQSAHLQTQLPPHVAVVFGSIAADLFVEVEKIEAGDNCQANNMELFPGGKGANQARAIGTLGVHTLLVGRVGTDAFGKLVLDVLNRYVDVAFVEHQAGRSTNAIARDWSDQAKESTGMAVIVNAKKYKMSEVGEKSETVVKDNMKITLPSLAANDAAGQEEVDSIDDILTALQPSQAKDQNKAKRHVLVLQLEVPIEQMEKAIGIAHERKTLVVMKASPPNRLPEKTPLHFLARCDVVVTSENEIPWILTMIDHRSHTTPADLSQVLSYCHKLATKLKNESKSHFRALVCMTPFGYVAVFKKHYVEHSIMEVDKSKELVATVVPLMPCKFKGFVGAADAATGGLVAALCREKPLPVALLHAMCVGTHSLKHRSAQGALPTYTQAVDFGAEHAIDLETLTASKDSCTSLRDRFSLDDFLQKHVSTNFQSMGKLHLAVVLRRCQEIQAILSDELLGPCKANTSLDDKTKQLSAKDMYDRTAVDYVLMYECHYCKPGKRDSYYCWCVFLAALAVFRKSMGTDDTYLCADMDACTKFLDNQVGDSSQKALVKGHKSDAASPTVAATLLHILTILDAVLESEGSAQSADGFAGLRRTMSMMLARLIPPTTSKESKGAQRKGLSDILSTQHIEDIKEMSAAVGKLWSSELFDALFQVPDGRPYADYASQVRRTIAENYKDPGPCMVKDAKGKKTPTSVSSDLDVILKDLSNDELRSLWLDKTTSDKKALILAPLREKLSMNQVVILYDGKSEKFARKLQAKLESELGNQSNAVTMILSGKNRDMLCDVLVDISKEPQERIKPLRDEFIVCYNMSASEISGKAKGPRQIFKVEKESSEDEAIRTLSELINVTLEGSKQSKHFDWHSILQYQSERRAKLLGLDNYDEASYNAGQAAGQGTDQSIREQTKHVILVPYTETEWNISGKGSESGEPAAAAVEQYYYFLTKLKNAFLAEHKNVYFAMKSSLPFMRSEEFKNCEAIVHVIMSTMPPQDSGVPSNINCKSVTLRVHLPGMEHDPSSAASTSGTVTDESLFALPSISLLEDAVIRPVFAEYNA